MESGLSRFWRKLAGLSAPKHLYHPVGIAVSKPGNVVAVTDQALGQLFIFDLAMDEVRTVPREVLGGVPIGVAVSGDEVWVTVPENKVLLAFGVDGSPRRSVSLEDCERPLGIAVDAERKLLYVTDTSSSQGKGHNIHVYGLESGELTNTLGKKGTGPGEFYFPIFLSLTPSGGLYVADTMNARVQELKADGTFVRQFGSRGDRFGQFDKPKGVATDSFGNVYIVDSFFSVVQIFNDRGELLLFFGGRGDSPGFLSNPSGIAIDENNRIYVTNGLNFRVDVYELVNTTASDSHAQPATAALTNP